MGCLSIGLAALLALAVPASIATASLLGAYVVLGVLAALATVSVLVNARRPRTRAGGDAPSRARALITVAALTGAYAVVVTAIHLAAA